MSKNYLIKRTELLLSKAIKEETQRLKEVLDFNPNNEDIEQICTEISVLVALKNYANDLIKKL